MDKIAVLLGENSMIYNRKRVDVEKSMGYYHYYILDIDKNEREPIRPEQIEKVFIFTKPYIVRFEYEKSLNMHFLDVNTPPDFTNTPVLYVDYYGMKLNITSKILEDRLNCYVE